MNWLFPGFLAGAALIGLPVVLHLLRRKPRQVVPFPSLRFLGESALRDSRRNQLLRWLALLLRCLAIALLCAAFARPFWGTPQETNRRALVIALDNSMSQQASGRWKETQSWALGQLDALAPGDQAGLLIMQPEPVWLVPMTRELARVRAALSGAQPGFGKTRYGPALRVAGETLAKTAAGTKILAWAADEQCAGWRGVDLSQKLPPGVRFRFIGIVPAPQRQAAIIGLRQSFAATNSLEVTVRQFPRSPDRRKLTVYAGEKPIATQSVSLHQGDNKLNIPWDWPASAAGLRVSLDADDLPADNSAWIARGPAPTNIVLLDNVSQTDFLAHALRSTRKLELAAFQPAPLPEGPWPPGSLVVLRGETAFRGAALQRLEQFGAAGGTAWIFVDGSAAQKAWLQQQGIRIAARPAAEEPWHLRDWDARHPALGAFAGQSLLPLVEVEFYRGFNLTGDTLAPLANWPDGRMAIAEMDAGGRHLFIAGFSLDRGATDWLAKPSFVPFVDCAARWLGAGSQAREDWRVDDTIPLPGGQGIWRALDSPASQKESLASGSVRPDAPGLYEFSGQGNRKVFAVNTPVDESDLSPWPHPDQLAALESTEAPPAKPRAAESPTAWAMAESQQRLWWWLLVAGVCALLVELHISNRTTL